MSYRRVARTIAERERHCPIGATTGRRRDATVAAQRWWKKKGARVVSPEQL